MSESMRLWALGRLGGPNVDSADSEKGSGTMPKRKPGAPIGNKNALRHGRYGAPLRAARLAALQAAVTERQQRLDEWITTVKPIDYDAICDELSALRRAKESKLTSS